MKKDKTKSIVSLILGLFFWVPLFNVLLGTIGLVFGVMALKDIKKHPNNFSGKWTAISGIVLCAIPLVGTILYILDVLFLRNI